MSYDDFRGQPKPLKQAEPRGVRDLRVRWEASHRMEEMHDVYRTLVNQQKPDGWRNEEL